jgi:Mn-dependent DtxR family transcriptional regulator
MLVTLLNHGDNVPGNLADLTEHHANSISRSLSQLENKGYVRNKGRGVWTLTPSGKEIATKIVEIEELDTTNNG